MKKDDRIEIWFVTGSQHLYGESVLQEVASNSAQIASGISASDKLPMRLVCKPVVVSTDEIRQVCLEANHDPRCAGLVLWMHTFSPAKMWITGLGLLQKPFLHLHTQYNQDLPWNEINMDFMNLNQAAHGDREAAFLHARMRLPRKVVVGHWSDPEVHERIGSWMCTVRAWHDMQGARFARFADNMRQVAVTEGDKIAAEARLGFSVNGFGVGDLAAYVDNTSDGAVTTLCKEYEETYRIAPELKKGGERHDSLRYAARQELGIRTFLEEGGFKGFTTNFEVLHGLKQLPGLAVQRLMADGYGFGGEGDWKTCALLRFMKVVAGNGHASASFMEEYTYHLDPNGPLVLGAHMLEVCPSIADGKPSLEVHPLSIGGKEDPVRLVFNARPGRAITASLIDLGNRFRIVASEVEVQSPPKPLPNLPVARAVWRCKPDFKTAAAAWLYAGGCHHTALSYDVTREQLEDFAEIAGIELVMIDSDTRIHDLKQQLRTNEVYYHLAPGIGR